MPLVSLTGKPLLGNNEVPSPDVWALGVHNNYYRMANLSCCLMGLCSHKVARIKTQIIQNITTFKLKVLYRIGEYLLHFNLLITG